MSNRMPIGRAVAVVLSLAAVSGAQAPGRRIMPPLPPPSVPPADSTVEAEIRTLMALNGDENIGDQLALQVLGQIRAKLPQVPPDVWERIYAKMDRSGMAEPMAKLYAAQFTPGEIRAMIAFFESPAGKKWIATRPQMSLEILKASQSWRIEKVKEIERLFQAETGGPR